MDSSPFASTAATDLADAAELRKPHEMIVLVPRSGRVTLTGRKLYNALLHVAQSRLDAMVDVPAATYRFEAPLPALLRTTGSSGEDRTAAKRYLKEMGDLKVDWESTAPGDGVKWKLIPMLVEPTIEVRHGENWVLWTYPPTIFEALREPRRWARINLGMLASLGTYTAVALYEICARYRDNPSGVTSRKSVGWWADALSQTPSGAERREWRKFKSERLRLAIEEINKETDLDIELIEHKEGRSVVEAQFSVRRKRMPAQPAAATVADANLILRAESLGIRELKMEGLIREFGEARVRLQLEALERRVANNRLRGIEQAYSYLRSLLRSEALPPAEGKEEAITAKEGRAAAQAPTPAPLTSGAPQPDPTAWLNERIAALKREIGGLNAEQRMALTEAALRDLAARNLVNAVVSRRAAQGDLLHGLLGSAVVRLYAERVHGPNWDQAPGGPSPAPG